MTELLLVLLLLAELAGVALLRRVAGCLERPAVPPGPPKDTEGHKKPDPVDEGFENLMRYAVRGETGFEREEE